MKYSTVALVFIMHLMSKNSYRLHIQQKTCFTYKPDKMFALRDVTLSSIHESCVGCRRYRINTRLTNPRDHRSEARQLRTNSYFQITASEQWFNCLVQGQNDRFLPYLLGDSIHQPFSYWPNTLTTRLPAYDDYKQETGRENGRECVFKRLKYT